ncbi:MAG: hypothetical protein JWP09_752 [Candidatus Taylorbacteria bacterium]|nr:hypothetical protein [Candidatus Taylorbacteria bacterium]
MKNKKHSARHRRQKDRGFPRHRTPKQKGEVSIGEIKISQCTTPSGAQFGSGTRAHGTISFSIGAHAPQTKDWSWSCETNMHRGKLRFHWKCLQNLANNSDYNRLLKGAIASAIRLRYGRPKSLAAA